MHLIRAMILTGIILSAAAYAAAQNATPPKPHAANGGDAVYANECLSPTYRLPDGWKFQKVSAPSPGQSKQQMILLKAKPASADPSKQFADTAKIPAFGCAEKWLEILMRMVRHYRLQKCELCNCFDV